MVFFWAVTYLFVTGIGIWGVNMPVGWGFAIINFVWWIGIGHAGTLISAILLLFRQSWRNSINRFAEAMTLVCRGLRRHVSRCCIWAGPGFSTGCSRIPTPCRSSPISAARWCGTSSRFPPTPRCRCCSGSSGLIPDLATLRDRSENRWARATYGILAMGWRGSASHWQKYETASLLLAGLATPLVLSVHTVVSFDFAVSIIPGWHTTIFPPYFVAGAIYSGFAMVVVLAIPLRALYGLEDFITLRHLDNSAKVMLATGLIVAYGYMTEAFMAWYSGNPYEQFMIWNRMTGPYALGLLVADSLQRGDPAVAVVSQSAHQCEGAVRVSLVVLTGMWLERYIIVVTSLHRDFLPSSWGMYYPTRWDWATYVGTIGLFFTLFFLFIRVLPMISIFEVRTLLPEAEVTGETPQ